MRDVSREMKRFEMMKRCATCKQNYETENAYRVICDTCADHAVRANKAASDDYATEADGHE